MVINKILIQEWLLVSIKIQTHKRLIFLRKKGKKRRKKEKKEEKNKKKEEKKKEKSGQNIACKVLRHVIFITSHLLHVIVKPAFFQVLDTAQSKKVQRISSPSHFSTFFAVLIVKVSFCIDKGDYTDNWHGVFCPNKERYFEPFMCFKH